MIVLNKNGMYHCLFFLEVIFMNGILVINKPENYTSRDIVNLVSKKLHTKKVGHTGTLDPLATGVLVLCIGDYTKFVSLFTNHEKEYVATIWFGIETDTLDVTGKVLEESNVVPSKEELKNVLKKFIGKQTQEVPIYSAKKVNGKKLYEYARNGENVLLPKQEIEVFDLKLLSYENNQAKILFHVSKGTYIRSLIRDIAYQCNTLGTMTSLQRIRQGNFKISDTITLDDLDSNQFRLLSYRDIFLYETYELSDKELFLVSHGNELFLDFTTIFLLCTYKGREIAFYKKEKKSYRPVLQFDKI